MPITSRADVFKRIAKGLGHFMPMYTLAGAAVTGGAPSSGYFNVQPLGWTQGTTYPNTIQSFPLPAGLPDTRMFYQTSYATSINVIPYLAYLYRFGTLNLAALGNQFTHDAVTFPVRRTRFGVADQPVTLTPFIYVTTATATTAPTFYLRTDALGAGYVNQDGVSKVGDRLFTMPAVATAIQSGYLALLNTGDSGVHDIIQIDVEAAGTAGAATVYGIEFLSLIGGHVDWPMGHDGLHAGLELPDIRPAVPVSGSVDARLVGVYFSSQRTMIGPMWNVVNT